MNRHRTLRIVSPLAKVTFVFAWWIAGMTLLALTASYGAPGPLIQATLLANNALFFVVGVRTFRGRGESTAPREWWRVTATSRSSVVMGVIALMLGSIIVFGEVERLLTRGPLTGYGPIAFELILIAAVYIYSAVRSRGRGSGE